MKFLFDLFPVIVFFAAYYLTGGQKGSCVVTPDLPITQEPILLATGLAILATVIQVSWLVFRKKKVDGMLWVGFAVVAIFGGATLYFRNPSFIQWKPTILYWTFAIVLLLSPFFLERSLIRTMLERQISAPDKVWGWLNAAWVTFFAFMGVANLVAVSQLSCNAWVNFKLYGLSGLLFLFAIGQALVLTRYVEEKP